MSINVPARLCTCSWSEKDTGLADRECACLHLEGRMASIISRPELTGFCNLVNLGEQILSYTPPQSGCSEKETEERIG